MAIQRATVEHQVETASRFPFWWVAPLGVGAVLAALGFVLDDYLLYVAVSWIIFGLLGLSLDLVWGKAGILSLGQTVFYGLSGYLYAVLATNFEAWTGHTLIWAIVAGIVMGGGFAAIVGYFIFYNRLGPLQTTIVTYTLTLILWTAAIGFTATIGEARVGGANGMSYVPSLVLGFGQGAAPLDSLGMYLTVLTVSVLVFIGVRAILRQPFGMVVEASRMNELKTELLGYDVRFVRLALFALSGAIAGIAGGLFASWAAYINPAVFSVSEALLVPIYVLVGGRGTLVGPFVGALVVGGLSYWLGGGVIGGQTTLAMGLGLILLVILFPAGIVGGILALWRRMRPQRSGVPVVDWTQSGGRARLLAAAPGTERDRAGGGVALATDGLTKRFGGVSAVDHVTLNFHDNEVHCLIGPNGAGKSTFLGTCVGLHAADEGKVVLSGCDVTRWQPFRRVHEGLAIKMQVARVFEEFTAGENLWLAAYSRHRDRKDAASLAMETLRAIGLEGQRDRLSGQLSHGEQQWLDIGMVLCLDPRVILLDEPTAGMTPDETRKTAILVRRLAQHAAIVVVDHDMEFVRQLAAPVTVLHQGAVFAQGRIEDLRENPRILDIYLGRRHGAARG